MGGLSIVLVGAAIFIGGPALFASIITVVVVRRPISKIDPVLHRSTYVYAVVLLAVACLCAAALLVRSARLPLVLAALLLYVASHFQMNQLRRRERELPSAPGPMKSAQAAKLESLARRQRRVSVASTVFIFATAPVMWTELGRSWGISWIVLGTVTALHGAIYTPWVLLGFVRGRGMDHDRDPPST
jgi:hypothetical protein